MQISVERLARELYYLNQANWLQFSQDATAALEATSDQLTVLATLLQQPCTAEGWPVHCPMISAAWLQPQLPSSLKDDFNPLLAYLVAEANASQPLSPHPLLVPDYFLAQLQAADAQPAADLSLLAVLAGLPEPLAQRVSPHPLFDPGWYIQVYADLPVAAHQHPFLHFFRYAKQERRSPSPGFNTRLWMLRRGGDAALIGNPLEDYLLIHLQDPSVPLPEPSIHGDVFGVDQDGRLIGWAWDPADDQPVNIEVFIGNQLVGRGHADQWREDLEQTGIVDPHAGFAISLRLDLIDHAIRSGVSPVFSVVATPASRDTGRQAVLHWTLPEALIPNLPVLLEQTLIQAAKDLVASGDSSQALIHVDSCLQRLPNSLELQKLRRQLCSSLYLQASDVAQPVGSDLGQELQSVEQELMAFEALLSELESALQLA